MIVAIAPRFGGSGTGRRLAALMRTAMVLLLLAGCDWFAQKPPPDAPPELPAPEPTGPVLPAPPRLGVAEVVTPPTVIRPSAVRDDAAPPLLDVWFDPAVTTFDRLGEQLDTWGFTRVDGDGRSWRVRPPDARSPAWRLVAAPGVDRVREALTREPLRDRVYRRGSDQYGALSRSWTWPVGRPPEVSITAGVAPPPPELPTALPPLARACLGPVMDELAMGLAVGPGWERGMIETPRSWALVVEALPPCDLSGWVALRGDAPVDTLSVGDRPLAQADDGWIYEQVVENVRRPAPTLDPLAEAAVDLLADAPDVVLARAVRDAAPGPLQEALYERFARRDAAAALAVAGGSTSPTLLAKAVGQDETLRARLLADPATPSEVLAAALAIWRPGPTSPPGQLAALLASPDPEVRERAWGARMEAEARACAARPYADLDVDALAQLYDACPQPEVRGRVFDRLRAVDPAAAEAALKRTFAAPETRVTGIAAVRAASAWLRWPLLAQLVADPRVDREVRRVALTSLVDAQRPEAADLQARHGAYLAYASPPEAPPVVVQP